MRRHIPSIVLGFVLTITVPLGAATLLLTMLLGSTSASWLCMGKGRPTRSVSDASDFARGVHLPGRPPSPKHAAVHDQMPAPILLPQVANNNVLTMNMDYAQPGVRNGGGGPDDGGRIIHNSIDSSCRVSNGDGDIRILVTDGKCRLIHSSTPRLTPQLFGDVSINAAAAIQAADAAAARLGKTVFFPNGTYKVSTPLVPSMGASWECQSYQKCILQTTSATADIIDLNNSYVTLSGFQFQSSLKRKGGSYIRVSGGNYVLQNILTTGAYNSLVLGSDVSNLTIRNFRSENAVAQRGVDIIVNGCTNCLISQLTLTNAPDFRPFAHIVLNNAGDLHCYDCNLLQAVTDLYISPGNNQSVSSLKFIGGYLDEAGSNSVAFLPSGNGSIDKILFQGTWMKTEGQVNMNIAPSGTAIVDFVQCIGCELYGPGKAIGYGVAAIQTPGTLVKNIQIIGGGTGNNATGYSFNGVTSFQLADAACGIGFAAAPTLCWSLSGTISIASLHDVHQSSSPTPFVNTAIIRTSNIHNNY